MKDGTLPLDLGLKAVKLFQALGINLVGLQLTKEEVDIIHISQPTDQSEIKMESNEQLVNHLIISFNLCHPVSHYCLIPLF